MQRSVKIQKIKAKRQLAADKFRKFQIENLNALFDFEVLLVNSRMNELIEERKTCMIEELLQEQRKLSLLKASVSPPMDNAYFLATDVRTKDQYIAKPAHKKSGNPDSPSQLPLSLSIDESSIMEDMTKIVKDMRLRSSAYDSLQPLHQMEFDFQLNRISAGGTSFCVGDRVIISSRATADDISGCISTISKDRLDIVVGDSKIQVLACQLKNGSIALRKRHDRKSLKRRGSHGKHL